MNPSRYLRQTSLISFGAINQNKLLQAKVLVVGLGGLGVPIAQYLNAMGVGTIGIVENDVIALHNLQRQVLYAENEVGAPKLAVGLKKLQAQNTNTKFIPFNTYLNATNALEIIAQFDVVVDATDNFGTRYLINDACVILNKPFVYGALHGFEGQISVFNFKNGPTYRCLFPNPPKQDSIPDCNVNGILGVLPGIIGTLQALEVIKVITDIGEPLTGKLLLYDGLTQQTRSIQFNRQASSTKISQLKAAYETPDCVNDLDTITIEEFLRLKTPFDLWDVREPSEFKDFHLPNAINVPLGQLQNRLNELSAINYTYLVCQSGKRSATAYQKIKAHKPNAQVINLSGGINHYLHHYGNS